MYSSANNHHGDVHGWFPKSYSNMVASNLSSNHGPHAPVAYVCDNGIHEEGWYPVTNTRLYGDDSLHPLVDKSNEELSSYTPKPFKTIPYKHVPFTAKAMARGKAHCIAMVHKGDRHNNKNKDNQCRKKYIYPL